MSHHTKIKHFEDTIAAQTVVINELTAENYLLQKEHERLQQVILKLEACKNVDDQSWQGE